jgi:hypothetical protein
LWGGNLSMLCGLLGTPYFPAIKGGILFLEDVGEHPYRIERMLTQLLHAGVLGRQKAVLLGQFTNYKLVAGHDKGFKLATVVDWLRNQVTAPVFTGLPFGHVATKVLLPFGALVDLSVHTSNGLIADACWTQQAGVACTIMVADCLPILMTDRQGKWVAAAHAGWRGLAGHKGRGVLETSIERCRRSMEGEIHAANNILVSN